MHANDRGRPTDQNTPHRTALTPTSPGSLTLTLTAEQSLLAEEGGWPEARLIDDLLEDLERQGICERVVVLLDTGAVAFSITSNRERPC